jgi:hypothetical protein
VRLISFTLLFCRKNYSASRRYREYITRNYRDCAQKVKIALAADLALQEYFRTNTGKVESWFNVISPAGRSVAELKRELTLLAGKKWKEILK